MTTLLLAIIYLAFVSLGLPDSLLGSAWPQMHIEMNMPTSAAGIVTMLISAGTILSSLASERVVRRLGTGMTVVVSTALTVIGLFGFSISPSFIVLCLFTLPYGIGAGSIDAALNNYVALNYSSRHMSWLHSFWGLGTIISPYVMSYALSTSLGWQGGYRSVGIIQLVILILLAASLPLWKKVAKTENNSLDGEKTEKENAKRETPLQDDTYSLGRNTSEAVDTPLTKADTDILAPEQSEITDDNSSQSTSIFHALKINGVPLMLLGFLGYCSAESTVSLWAGTYFFDVFDVSSELAAALNSLFFIGITVGRFLSGFISNRLGDRNMIRTGLAISSVGVLLVATSSVRTVAIIGFLLIGLGYAPIYPSVIHSTPDNFGRESSQSIIGIQMASAYVGTTFMPTLFGLISEFVGIRSMPLYLAVFMLLCFSMTELLYKRIDKNAVK